MTPPLYLTAFIAMAFLPSHKQLTLIGWFYPPKSKTPTDTLCAPLLGITEGVFSTSLLCEIHTNAGDSCGAGKTFSGVDYNFN